MFKVARLFLRLFVLGMFCLGLFITTSVPIYMALHKRVSTVQSSDELPKYGTPPKNPQLAPIIKLADKDDDMFCTAFVIDANYALTAAHCLVDDSGEMTTDEIHILKEDDTDTKVRAKPVGVDLRMDVGLIRGDFNNFKFLAVNFYSFSIAEVKAEYYAFGYPAGQKHLSIIPFYPEANNDFFIAGKGFLIPGMSGGPLVDVTHKVVVGINSSVDKGVVNFASPIGALGAFGIEP